jgi:hypothetical protein
VRPVPEYNAKNWLLKALRETAHAMESLIWDVDEGELSARPTGADDGEWSCLELVAHMCEMERRYIDRLERIVRLDEPNIEAFGGESSESPATVADQGVFDLMDDLSVLRQQTVYLLWSLDDAGRARDERARPRAPVAATQALRSRRGGVGLRRNGTVAVRAYGGRARF